MSERAFTSINRSVGWFVLSYAVAVVGYLGVNAAASRMVGRHSFGLFMVVVTSTALVGQFGLLGVHRSGLREAARINDLGGAELAPLRADVRAVCKIPLPAASLVTALVVMALAHSENLGPRLVLALCTGALVYLNGLQKLTSCFLRGLGHVRVAGLLEGRSGGALVALGQVVTVVAVWRLVPGAGLAGGVAAATIGFAVPMVWAMRRLNRLWAGAALQDHTWTRLVVVARRDWKFASIQIGGYVNATLDLWLCAILLSAVSTSMFGASLRAAQLLLIPMTSLQVVFSPAVARLSQDPDRRRLERLVRTGSTFATLIAAVFWLPMFFAPGLVLGTMFGHAYAEDGVALMLLATGFFMNAATGLSSTTLAMSQQEGWVSLVQWIGVGLRIVCGTAAALLWGPIGLAASSMSVTILIYLLMWVQARRHIGVATHLTLRPSARMLTRVAG